MRIELRNVRKRFGRMEALRGLDLDLPAGTRAALVGPNGSGKSTLIRALLGLLACEGEVRLDGRSPFEDRLLTARRLAYVPQTAPQLSASVEEVIHTVAFTRGLSPEAIGGVAARLDLDLAPIRARPFRNLSGGMKQKLLIAAAFAARSEEHTSELQSLRHLAAAFAARPALLVLDEPTASLDARARERFHALCAELPAGTTLLLCSHRFEEIRHLADHVIALEDGRVTWDGPARDFLPLRPRAQEVARG